MPVVINGSTGISGVDGSAGTPAFQGSDTNTGIRFGTDIVSLVTGGSDRLYIDSSGRLGVGTNSPSEKLSINEGNIKLTSTDTFHYIALSNTSTGGRQWTLANAGASDPTGVTAGNLYLRDSTAGANRIAIDSSGRVGIGTTSPSRLLHISAASGDTPVRIQTATTGAFLEFQDSATTAGRQPLVGAIGDNLVVYTSAGSYSERARFDSSGRLLVGTSTSPSTGSLQYSKLFISGNTAGSGGSQIAVTRGQAFNGLASGQDLGYVYFGTYDGGEYGVITCFSDGASTASSTPGRLEFRTTASGATSPTERMRITSAGYLKVTSDGTYHDSTGLQHELTQSTSGTDTLLLRSKNASLAAGILEASATRGNNTAYNFFRAWSSGFSDLEFNLRGDGNAFADGTWTGGGADYAEYFEWADSNPNEEDRRGISVVLDGDKIREAAAGEEPIGVISGNPSVVGDAAWNKWSGKYLRDDFGTYIQEDYEVVNDEDETVVQQRRKLNPAYDPDVEYIPREDRAEWDCVGLMGKLRIRKGQVTGARWIKMRDISATVEEWLVR